MPSLPAFSAFILTSLVFACNGAVAQDAARGAQLFDDTRGVTGKPVANCVSCHADLMTLREMITNRGVRPDDARAVRRLVERALAGARAGATGAKSQFRGVLTEQDIADLAAYIASVRRG